MGKIMLKIINGVGAGPSDEIISFIEDNIGINFPKSFLRCIKMCEEGRPEKYIFSFKNFLGKQEKSCLSAFLGFSPKNKYNILRNYLMYFYRFHPYFVPFAAVGNGDFIGFDYSIEGFEDSNPPIVYFDHEQPSEQSISTIAINFETFLEKLESDDEINS